MNNIITLVLVAVSVGLGNFAAAAAIGLSGVNGQIRTKVATVFGAFETGMPIVGLVIGKQLSVLFGGRANIIGGGLLILIGLYEVFDFLRHDNPDTTKEITKNWKKLLFTGLALSVDNLIVGFGLGTRNEPLLMSALVIGVTCVILTLLGLEVGNMLSKKVDEYAGVISGLILCIVGLGITLNII